MGKSRNIARLVVDATGAVDATNLGNAVPADGSITEAKLASDSVTAAKIATGAVGTDELAATAVTAGTYGTASAIPAITVDADGRITGVTTNSVSATPADGSITDAKIADDITAGTNWFPLNEMRYSIGVTDNRQIASGRVLRSGTYRFRIRGTTETSYTNNSQLGFRIYQNGVALGTEVIGTVLNGNAVYITSSDVTLTAGSVVQFYLRNLSTRLWYLSGFQCGVSNGLKVLPISGLTGQWYDWESGVNQAGASL